MNPSRATNDLINDVEKLLTVLGDEHGPHIDELRMRITQTIGRAKRAMASQRTGIVARIGHYAGSMDDYITGFPRLGFLTGVLVGGLIVYLKGLGSSKA
jgi:ElaB/YqjD/DUF883 family membrane-anchored ribosome-binding protein